jgi:hypothetical protein
MNWLTEFSTDYANAVIAIAAAATFGLRTSPRAKGHVGTINCHTRFGRMLSYY